MTETQPNLLTALRDFVAQYDTNPATWPDDMAPLLTAGHAAIASAERTTRLHDNAERMRGIIERLLKWADYMGGWDGSAWRDAEAVLRTIEGHDEPEDDDTISPEA
jgi:hypothetical protein